MKTLQWLDQRKRLEARQQHYREEELAEVTGRPMITQMAQRMQRGPVQWERWERDRKSKVFESKRMRAHETRERELAEMEKGGKFVN